MMKQRPHLLRRFRRAEQGVALIEFALVFPIIMLLLFGALEIGRAIVITQRVEKMNYVLADVTSQYAPATVLRSPGELSETELRNNVFPLFSRIMGSYADAAQQNMILTSVFREAGGRVVKWQMAGGGTLTRGVNSVVNGASPSSISAGMSNSPAPFSGDPDVAQELAAMSVGENLIVAEVFYYYQPVWSRVLMGSMPKGGVRRGSEINTILPKLLVKRMYFRPRNGDLECLPNTFTYKACLCPDPKNKICT